MTTQTHTVHTDALGTLGTIIDEKAGRDAIHLAVEPVIAGEKLHPGQHIRIVDGRAVANGETYGIVDPFVKGPVLEGQRFWFVIYPRQITSLRHVWEHPAFPAKAISSLDPTDESREWLENFAARLFSYARDDDDEGTRLVRLLRGIECGGSFGADIEYSDDVQPSDELYMHYERYTGKPAPKKAEYFRCAC